MPATANLSAILVDGATSAGRSFNPAVDVTSIVDDPTTNYRWGDADERDVDLASEEFQNFAASIAAVGVKEPIGLRVSDNGYVVVYGFSRLAAAKVAGLSTVPAFIFAREVSDSEMLMLQVTENGQKLKRSVNWVVEGEAFAKVREQLKEECGEDRDRFQVAWDKFCASQAEKDSKSVDARLRLIRGMSKEVYNLCKSARMNKQAAKEMGGLNATQSKAILNAIKGTKTDYPDEITGTHVRAARRKLREQIGDEAAPIVRVNSREHLDRTQQAIDVLVRRLLTDSDTGKPVDLTKVAVVESLSEFSEWFKLHGIGIGMCRILAPNGDNDEAVELEASRFIGEEIIRVAMTDRAPSMLLGGKAKWDGEAKRQPCVDIIKTIAFECSGLRVDGELLTLAERIRSGFNRLDELVRVWQADGGAKKAKRAAPDAAAVDEEEEADD